MTDLKSLYTDVGTRLREMPTGRYAIVVNPDDWKDIISALDTGDRPLRLPDMPGAPPPNLPNDPPLDGELVGMMHGHRVYVHRGLQPGSPPAIFPEGDDRQVWP